MVTLAGGECKQCMQSSCTVIHETLQLWLDNVEEHILLLQLVDGSLAYTHICSHSLVDMVGEVYGDYAYQDHNCLIGFVCKFLNVPNCPLYHNMNFRHHNHSHENVGDDTVRDDAEDLGLN